MNVTAKQLRSNLGEYLDETIRQPVTVTRNGRNLCVMINYEVYQEMARQLDKAAMERAEDNARYVNFKQNGGISNDDAIAWIDAYSTGKTNEPYHVYSETTRTVDE